MPARTGQTEHGDSHRGKTGWLKNRVGGWFFRTIFRPGWPQWSVLGVTVVVFILAVLALTGGTDYREDPSAIVPRSAAIYMETRDLPAFLKSVGSWRVWQEERRNGIDERNQLQVDIAGLVSERVAGMSTSSPLRWLAATTRAAYCLSAAPAEEGGETWALYIIMADPAEALAEIEIERGMTLETLRGTRETNGVFRLTGSGTGELYFGVISPWLVISSQATLPEFALESARKPAFSLANSGLIPSWKRGKTVRGVVNPTYTASKTGVSAYNIIAGWMAPDVRINYLARIGKNGLETTFGAEALSGRVRGSGLWWPLLSGILVVIAVAALAVAFMVLLVVIGWGGWLKTKAVRAGIIPASGPEAVHPSEAFRVDAGLERSVDARMPTITETPATHEGAPQDLPHRQEIPRNVDVDKPSDNADGVDSAGYMGDTMPHEEPVEGYFELDKQLSEGAIGPKSAEIMAPESEFRITSSTSEHPPVNLDDSDSDTNKSTN